jgi:hypothetical protein
MGPTGIMPPTALEIQGIYSILAIYHAGQETSSTRLDITKANKAHDKADGNLSCKNLTGSKAM